MMRVLAGLSLFGALMRGTPRDLAMINDLLVQTHEGPVRR